MHLFHAEAKEEMALCGAKTSAYDLITVQYCLRQLIDGIPVGNICRTCVGFAAWWAEGHCRKLETDAILLRARALRLHERDATHHRNSVEGAVSEADGLLEQARKDGRLASSLAMETGLIAVASAKPTRSSICGCGRLLRFSCGCRLPSGWIRWHLCDEGACV